MGNISITGNDTAYINLASAIIARAIDDVIKGKLNKGKPMTRSVREQQRDAKMAFDFLHDETRLCMYTNFSPRDMDKIIQIKYERIRSGRKPKRATKL